jgi:CheY-like chemotaxis protein
MTALQPTGPPPLLLVEDNDEDYIAFMRVCRGAGFKPAVVRLSRGDEALDYLYRRQRFERPESAPRPGLILLDLNLAGEADGFDVLAGIKQDAGLRTIPVVVLSTSSRPVDIERSYQLGANSYQVKAIDYASFKHAMKLSMDYWFNVSTLPTVQEKIDER